MVTTSIHSSSIKFRLDKKKKGKPNIINKGARNKTTRLICK